MNYVEGIKIGGATAAQIPSIKGTGAPTTETYGAVGCLYMNTDNGDMYKCIAVNDGAYIWVQSANEYYHTTREKIGDTPANGYEHIWGLYQELVDKFGGEMVEYKVGEDFTNRAYVFTTGEYSQDGGFAIKYKENPVVRKPKYLILSGIHGTERKTVYSTYKFIRDVLSGYNVPKAFREGVTISVMPVGTPDAFNAFQTPNKNGDENRQISGVNINRNFGYNWNSELNDDPNKANWFISNGDYAESEKETQAIIAWLKDNTDADLFIDFHNNSALNEKVVVMGFPDNITSTSARKVAMSGIDRVIPFWRDVLRYHTEVECDGYTMQPDGKYKREIAVRPIIYSYSATPNGNGMAFGYAQGVLCIPSIAIETVSYYGDNTGWTTEGERIKNQTEAIAMGAEALGNILIEFYNSEVSKMKNFRVETGSYFPAETIIGTTTITLENLPKNTKVFEFYADGLTMEKLYAIGDTGTDAEKAGKFITSAIGSFFTQHTKCVTGYDQSNKVKQYGSKSASNHIQNIGSVYGWDINPGTTQFKRNTEDNSISFDVYGILKGNYHWVAYCWD